MKVSYKKFELPFVHPFTISRGTKTHQPTLIVSLEHFGITGYGEAPAISYYNIPVEKMIEELESKKTLVEKYAFTDPERYSHYIHHLFPKNSFLVCALDIAGWDLFGKIRNQPLYKLWGEEMARIPPTDFTIGIDSIEKMVNKMKEKPWPIYKIKLGTEEDIEIISTLRKHTDALFRVDANSGWQLHEALEKIPKLKELGVEFVEQPLEKDNWEDMKILFKESSLPLFADESCVEEADVETCARCFHGINIKLTKCGGLTPARRMIKKARSLGLAVMVGSMNESSIGTSAIAHLLPSIDHVDMDGPLLLAEDLATGLSFEEGKAVLSGKPGLGVEIKFGPF
jgi:L-alanine-DL-glutamate epimerase-like enolase superfamily enzyme